ncbi:MAG: hypothetical protein ACREL6_12760, partial [Gemmatimonadales bacterium]
MLAAALLAATLAAPPDLAGSWRAALDLAGGPLRFTITISDTGSDRSGQLCNGSRCDDLSSIDIRGDTVIFGIADYDATITAVMSGDSLAGTYRNVGNRGPRSISFRAVRGTWEAEPATPALSGSWDVRLLLDGRTSPRVLRIWNTDLGLEGTWLSATGDYGLFWGRAESDSFSL